MSAPALDTGRAAAGQAVDEPSRELAHSRGQRMLIRVIEAYQRAFEGRPSPCRFFPSCSEYGVDAIHAHGAARGSWLTLRRLARCRPFGPSGYDPVPSSAEASVPPSPLDPPEN